MIWISRFRVKLFWMKLSKANEYVDQIRSRHFSMRNLFIINRFEHIELEESVDSTIYNQNRVFLVFVRVSRNEETISNEMHSEQWTRIDLVLSKIEDRNMYSEIASHSIMIVTNNEFNEHTICSMYMQQI